MIYWQLFWTFLKIGAVTFGGGYAMIALIQQDIVAHGWATSAEFANMVAVSQMTPGPIAANTAVFVGKSQAGIPGAVCAMAGLILPPLVYSSVAVVFLQKLKSNAVFQRIIRGVRAAAMGLIASAVVFFAETSLLEHPLPQSGREYMNLFTGRGDWAFKPSLIGIAVFAVLLTAIVTLKLKPFWTVLLSGVLALGLYFIMQLMP